MIPRFIVAIIALITATIVDAQVRWNQAYQNYIDKYNSLAVEQMKKYAVPASITLSQALLESGAGKSELARKGNNHFGIKCHNWKGRKVYYDDDKKNECFRSYKNVRDSYEDHSLFLRNNSRYDKLFKLSISDYKGWAKGLKAAGYASDPQYAKRLISIIEVYGLWKYDSKTKGEKHNKHNGNNLREIIKHNDLRCIIAQRGDTFASLSQITGISTAKLAHYNEIDKDAILEEGDIVYLEKKAKQAPRKYKGKVHVVSPGESMYSISQTYGIRLANLYKLNTLPIDYNIQVGDTLFLR